MDFDSTKNDYHSFSVVSRLRASGFSVSTSSTNASLILRFSAISLVFGLFACGSSESTVQRAPAPQQLSVVTTFLPITMFTEAVAGECADVTALIPPSLGPHDFQASPSDLSALSKASVLVQNGLGIEEFLDDLVRSAANPDLVVIDSSRGVATIKPATISVERVRIIIMITNTIMLIIMSRRNLSTMIGMTIAMVSLIPIFGWIPCAPLNRCKTLEMV